MIVASSTSRRAARAQIAPVLLFALSLAVSGEGKGGGGHGRGSSSTSSGSSSGSSSSSSSSGSSSGGGSSGGTVITSTGSGSSRRCFNEHNQQIKCPVNKKAYLIAGSIVGGLVGLVVILSILIWFLKRRRHLRVVNETTEVPTKPTPPSRKNTNEKDYERLKEPPV
ncbi:hypothetical protein PC9H_007748 [Pleurotus ostreatus]|uniref:Uncharacterized protein n=1 Tax=Pleurotus ostreatus TaxID=5322 RepID=A0A8H7DRZ1_PLEOS|nr:uncharacterized protein PC9H_007748 [Pleurotus ostreatus]KAF7428524.1 hypothetical protein PC9H_007748 [Pleurotus ostreatus]KAJ8696679.1 hypothetical protein PTI98_006528 [Pleurotus ostreatus]